MEPHQRLELILIQNHLAKDDNPDDKKVLIVKSLKEYLETQGYLLGIDAQRAFKNSCAKELAKRLGLYPDHAKNIVTKDHYLEANDIHCMYFKHALKRAFDLDPQVEIRLPFLNQRIFYKQKFDMLIMLHIEYETFPAVCLRKTKDF